MKKELTKKEYEYLLECVSEFMPQYCIVMKESLFVDENIVSLGFAEKPVYVVDMAIAQQDRNNFYKIYKEFDKKRHKSEANYDKFDFYYDFYRFLKEFD